MGVRDWFAGRRRRAEEAEQAAQAAETGAVTAPPTEQQVLASLNRVNAMLAAAKAPPVVTARVVRVARTINDALPRLRNLGLGSPEAYSVVSTATTYLPESVGAYLRLPREWADTRPIDGRRTSLMVLVDQLELLGSTMDEILDAANRADAQALLAHGMFLEAKFGHSSGADLTLGSPDE